MKKSSDIINAIHDLQVKQETTNRQSMDYKLVEAKIDALFWAYFEEFTYKSWIDPDQEGPHA